MDHLSPLEMPGQVANHSGLFVASPWLAHLTTATLTGSSRHGPFRRKALIPNGRCAQPACWRPTAAFSIVGSSSSTMFAAGPSGTKLSSLVTRAITPGYGALGGSDLSR